ncbi:lysophosphatidic acid phosphatase type 6-like [Anneissia japonica]|uniref:lysophosphatidic acid phosphatase type 6-like n=1 Tax=Anneissia japonica TaxID=1529436 RepID=UPI0014255684|nr:lysophosphatidic acid phosphatase type 6-like [Anneissia japonica]XP_033096461.1 lysophosphatidic acid phosphatase type 6-like [Anneissia japonica]
MVRKKTVNILWAVSGVVAAKTLSCNMDVDSVRSRATFMRSPDHAIDQVSDPSLRLKTVQIFFRHGARTPVRTIPNIEKANWDEKKLFEGAPDTYIDYDLCNLDGGPRPEAHVETLYRRERLSGGSFKGQLTARGMNQMYNLGKSYRKHYVDQIGYLSTEFNSTDIYFRSTNIARTIASLRCVVAGLYGKSLKSLKSDPVKIYLADSESETLYPNWQGCEAVRKFVDNICKNTDVVPGVRHGRLQLQELIDLHEDHHHLDIVSIRDNLIARLAHGLSYPTFFEPLLDMIERHAIDITMFQMIAHKDNHSQQHHLFPLMVGPLVNLILENIGNSIEKKRCPKLYMYSGHDTTLMPLLAVLNIDVDHWPPWSADLIIELYENKQSEHFIRVLYMGKEKNVCDSEEGLIPVEKFQKCLQQYTIKPSDYAKNCSSPVQVQ